MSICIDAKSLAHTVQHAVDDGGSTRDDWLDALDLVFGASAAAQPDDLDPLIRAITECLVDRDEPAWDRTAKWLRGHETESQVWAAINRLFDELRELADDDS